MLTSTMSLRTRVNVQHICRRYGGCLLVLETLLSKCFLRYGNISFTDHVVGQGNVQMRNEKVDKIKQAKCSRTKKQVRSFLGSPDITANLSQDLHRSPPINKSHHEGVAKIRPLECKKARGFDKHRCWRNPHAAIRRWIISNNMC